MPRAGRDTQEWRRLRKQCFARDKAAHAPCHICGQPIDYGLKPSSTPDAWEPDHRFTVKSHRNLRSFRKTFCLRTAAATGRAGTRRR